MISDIQKVSDPADPRRCGASTANGQCMNLSVDGGNVCLVHGGNKQIEAQQRKQIYDFRAMKWRNRLQQMLSSDAQRSLFEEVGVMRIMFEEKLTKCITTEDLLREGAFLQQQAQIIERLVTSAHKLEKSVGNTLDKSSAIQFAMEIVAIVQKHLDGHIDQILELPPEGREDAVVNKVLKETMIDAITGEIETALKRTQAKMMEERD